MKPFPVTRRSPEKARTMEITEEEYQTLYRLLDFIKSPRRFGCIIDLGDADTYEERVGFVFSEAEDALMAIGDRRAANET
jgi:hypothetical protein